jgi:hypothetical protein
MRRLVERLRQPSPGDELIDRDETAEMAREGAN